VDSLQDSLSRSNVVDAAAHEAAELRDFNAAPQPEQDADAFPPDQPPTDEEWEEMWAEEMERRDRERESTSAKIARGNMSIMDAIASTLDGPNRAA
jgi:hypothetical protein